MIKTFLKYLPPLLLALLLDGIDLILAVIDLVGFETIIVAVVVFLINTLQAIFGLIFWLILFIYSVGGEVKMIGNFVRRMVLMSVGALAEEFPGINDVIGFLPLRTIAVVYIILEESGVISKITQKFKSFAQSLPILKNVSMVASLLGGINKLEATKNINEESQSNIVSKAKHRRSEEDTGFRLVSRAKENQNSSLSQIVILLIFAFLLSNFAFAEEKRVLFYAKNLENEILVSAVFINQKTKNVINYPEKSYYVWEISGLNNPLETSKPIIRISNRNDFPIYERSIKITVVLPNLKKEVYKGTLKLNRPDVAVIRKLKDYFELPFVGLYSPNEILEAKPYYFSSQNLSYIWYLNDIYLSNSKTINSSLLKTGYLILKVRNLDSPQEFAREFLVIK